MAGAKVDNVTGTANTGQRTIGRAGTGTAIGAIGGVKN